MTERRSPASPASPARTFVVVGDDSDPAVFCDRAAESLRAGSAYIFEAVEQQDDVARRRAPAMPVPMSMNVSGVTAPRRFRLIRGWIGDRWVTISASKRPVEFDLFEDAPRR